MQEEKPPSSNISNEPVNHSAITTISSNQLDNIVPIQSDNQKMFDDEDDELFMNVDCEHLEGTSNAQKPAEFQVPQKSAESQVAQKSVQSKVPVKAVRISTTVSKRVKYENSSSSSDDEDNSKTDKSNPVQSSRPQASVQKPPVGIRKRNIF